MQEARGSKGNSGRCEGCGKRLLFLKHVDTLKVAPIEEETSPDGNIAAFAETYAIVPKERRADYAGRLHKNHFATCPNRARFGARAGAEAW